MSDKKKRLPYDGDTQRELFDNLLEVASATECTGLIPAAPESTADATSYSDIYDIPLAADASAAKRHSQPPGKTAGRKSK